MRIGQAEITLREAIFSVTIASVLFFIGFIISSKIEHAVNRSNLEYRQAAQISNNADEFEIAMATDVGNAFIEGKFKAVDVVSHEKLDGVWMWIYADYQKYTMHTRVVTYTVTDSKGRTHMRTKTETYWTWDTYRTEKRHSNEVEYIGNKFMFDKFNYSLINRNHKMVDDGWHKRIEFSAIPTEFNASAYTKLSDNTVSDNTALYRNISIRELYELNIKSIAVPLFWTLWSFLTVCAVVAFVFIDNRWIED